MNIMKTGLLSLTLGLSVACCAADEASTANATSTATSASTAQTTPAVETTPTAKTTSCGDFSPAACYAAKSVAALGQAADFVATKLKPVADRINQFPEAYKQRLQTNKALPTVVLTVYGTLLGTALGLCGIAAIAGTVAQVQRERAWAAYRKQRAEEEKLRGIVRQAIQEERYGCYNR